MRKFLISSAKYTGAIEVVYDSSNLHSVSFAQAVIEAETIAGFKRALPATLAAFVEGAWATAETRVIEADYEVTFDAFWGDYKNKVNRKRAEGLWSRLSKTEQLAAWQGVKQYDAWLKGLEWKRNKADPDTYLRNRYWENEYK